jgi:hypothetical protein
MIAKMREPDDALRIFWRRLLHPFRFVAVFLAARSRRKTQHSARSFKVR